MLFRSVADGSLCFFLATGDDAGATDPMGFATLGEAMDAIPPQNIQAAIDCNITGQGGTVAALLQNTPVGSIFASSTAAMALLTEGRCRRIEPMGEMEAGDGPIDVYAVWPSG